MDTFEPPVSAPTQFASKEGILNMKVYYQLADQTIGISKGTDTEHLNFTRSQDKIKKAETEAPAPKAGVNKAKLPLGLGPQIV